MATNIKRPSLFNRRFSRLLKPVDSLGPAGVKVRADEDGFEDLDDYFSQEFENKASFGNAPIEMGVEKIEEEEAEEPDYIVSQAVRHSLGPNEYTVPLKGSSSDDDEREEGQQDQPNYDDDAPMMDDDYGAMEPSGVVDPSVGGSEDDEINFSPNITLRRPVSSPRTEKSPLAAPKKMAPAVKPKKTAPASKPKAQTKQPSDNTPKDKNSNSVVVEGGNFYLSDELNLNGMRQSRRTRISPLEFWRGETVKYSVDEALKIPVVVGVVRRAKTPQKSRNRPFKKQQPTTAKSSTSNKRRREVEEELEEAGFVPGVNLTAKVIDYDTHEEEERLLAISADQHKPTVIKGESFAISTVFEEGTFLTAGILSFPPSVSKPSRNSAKHALVFYVISGVFQVSINENSFVIGTGGQFIVPRGNHYQLKNLQDAEGKLHFCHCMDSREA